MHWEGSPVYIPPGIWAAEQGFSSGAICLVLASEEYRADDYIRDYSKYLGLNSEEMIEEFNEYLFDYTSKISIDDIKSANKKNKEETKKPEIVSPYTIEKKQQRNIPKILIYVLIALIIGIVIYCVILFIKDDGTKNNIISYHKEVMYELA